jgi:hypothetical protein
MKLLVWSGTPSGTVLCRRDSAGGFFLAVSQPFHHIKWIFHRLGLTGPEFYSASGQGAASVDMVPTLRHPNVYFSPARWQLSNSTNATCEVFVEGSDSIYDMPGIAPFCRAVPPTCNLDGSAFQRNWPGQTRRIWGCIRGNFLRSFLCCRFHDSTHLPGPVPFTQMRHRAFYFS